jgi:3-deoxy-manno-octulosonate cytidylyltransferase (CMP-KDO synthetase)
MSFKVVIPARFASTRLPGKPLLDIAGKTMIQRVYEQACLSEAEEIVIATDDERIEAAALSFGAKVVMTSDRHPSGTDRLQEVAEKLSLQSRDIVVNVQGDEPLIPPEVINQVASNLSMNEEAGIATLCEEITEIAEVIDPNIVKVVYDSQGFANYFSRAPIPWNRDSFANLDELSSIPVGSHYFRHIGIYAYRVDFLHAYVDWDTSMTETCESLEQLRALSNGVRIHVEKAIKNPPPGVDTKADLQRVTEFLQG